jgi:hypothetical protein
MESNSNTKLLSFISPSTGITPVIYLLFTERGRWGNIHTNYFIMNHCISQYSKRVGWRQKRHKWLVYTALPLIFHDFHKSQYVHTSWFVIPMLSRSRFNLPHLLFNKASRYTAMSNKLCLMCVCLWEKYERQNCWFVHASSCFHVCQKAYCFSKLNSYSHQIKITFRTKTFSPSWV